MTRTFTLIACILMFFQLETKAQLQARSANSGNTIEGWKDLTSTDFVKITYKYQECRNPSEGLYNEYVFLSFQNLTNKDITIIYKEEIHYGSTCINCKGDNDELRFTLKIPAGRTVIGSCETKGESSLSIFSKHLDLPNKNLLNEFKIKDIQLAQ